MPGFVLFAGFRGGPPRPRLPSRGRTPGFRVAAAPLHRELLGSWPCSALWSAGARRTPAAAGSGACGRTRSSTSGRARPWPSSIRCSRPAGRSSCSPSGNTLVIRDIGWRRSARIMPVLRGFDHPARPCGWRSRGAGEPHRGVAAGAALGPAGGSSPGGCATCWRTTSSRRRRRRSSRGVEGQCGDVRAGAGVQGELPLRHPDRTTGGSSSPTSGSPGGAEGRPGADLLQANLNLSARPDDEPGAGQERGEPRGADAGADAARRRRRAQQASRRSEEGDAVHLSSGNAGRPGARGDLLGERRDRPAQRPRASAATTCSRCKRRGMAPKIAVPAFLRGAGAGASRCRSSWSSTRSWRRCSRPACPCCRRST